MILVTVGTTDFDALICCMDELAPTLGEPVVAQIGRGDYQPRQMESFRFAPSLEPYLASARLVVSHGGLGTVMEVVRRRLPLVAVSNPDRYDLHQDDLLSTMESAGHLIWCRTLDDLDTAITRAGVTQFVPYVEPECRIQVFIVRFLDGEPKEQLLRDSQLQLPADHH